jgi:hypothetical protein
MFRFRSDDQRKAAFAAMATSQRKPRLSRQTKHFLTIGAAGLGLIGAAAVGRKGILRPLLKKGLPLRKALLLSGIALTGGAAGALLIPKRVQESLFLRHPHPHLRAEQQRILQKRARERGRGR